MNDLKTLRKRVPKDHILNGSFYLKYPPVSPWRQKADQWLPGAGVGGMNEGWLLKGYGVILSGDENALEPDRGDGCTTVRMHETFTDPYPLKGSMVNFMLCEFYLD